ncbi:MAG: HlyD family efflux transporter periplasmic adaptor subunit [Candidatus Limiplasma sp.]|nr:HlyD family efflux transporter periplasmic adaptor subunit [Candidatus Limiplasma sp.]
MQPQNPNNGMQPNQPFSPYTPEQLLQWQQYGIPQQQFTPEILQQMQLQGIAQPQVTPEMMVQWQQQLYQMHMQQMQQVQQMQGVQLPPPSKRPRKPKDHQHRGGGFLRFVQILAVLGAVGFLGWFILNNTRGTAPTTAVIEMGTLGTTYRGDALIVRNETAYNDEGVQSIEYVAQEGSVVYRGNVLCYVYSTGYSSREMKTLQDYRDQIKNYQRTLLKGETAYDQKMTRLESDVIQRGMEVRKLVQGSRGNLINQENILDTAITQRQNYFRSKYSSDMRLNRLYDDETTQEQRIDSWIKQWAATQEGIVSFYTDGYEHSLTPADFEKYTPTEVRDMINGKRPEGSTSSRGRIDIYRLVKKANYAVLMLIKDNTWNPVEGSTHKLMLEQFSSTVVNAQVLSFTRAGGELLVRLAVMGDVTPVLYMRTCQAELGEYADAMLVPSSAIYEQNGAKGVVIITGDNQLFVPVNIIQESGGKTYISAIQTGVLSVGQTVRLFR